MAIKDIRNPWRDRLRPAQFRGATFHVEVDTVAGGRRAIVHQYPKRNVPYSEDMGRSARRFAVNGYLIGPNYLLLRDILIAALERNGPGVLRLPFPVFDDKAGDNLVMAGDFNIITQRDKGGYCEVEMQFSEYGKPGHTGPVEDTAGNVNKEASLAETTANAYMQQQSQTSEVLGSGIGSKMDVAQQYMNTQVAASSGFSTSGSAAP